MQLIGEEQSFSLTAYVEAPGYVTVIPRGYLFKQVNGETWIASLLPEMFYGASGAQLSHTWRQYLPSAGEQVILSRFAGKPEVPRGEIYWRRLTPARREAAPALARIEAAAPSNLLPVALTVTTVGALVLAAWAWSKR